MAKMNKPRIRILEIGGLPDAILGINILKLIDFAGDMWRHRIRKSPTIPADAKDAVIEGIEFDRYELLLLDPDDPRIEAGPEPGRTWIRQDGDGKMYVWKTANPDVGEPNFPGETPDE